MTSRLQTRIFPPTGATGPVAPLVGALRSLGEFRLLRLLGSGGMSAVYLAYHPPSRRTVAVKVLADHLASDHSCVRRFAQEAQLSRVLEHPNLVRGYGYGRDPLTHREFLVMEFIDGPTAEEALARRGRLSVSEAVGITIDIARGLEYLHQERWVHRDIKPGNILLVPNGTAKLADLGVAKSLRGAVGLTSCDQGIGTPYYMPWEQTINAGLVDARSDLFALGATLYHLVTGRVPFPGDSDQHIGRLKELDLYRPACDLDPDLPPEFDDILAKLIARDPRRRFGSATELIDVLYASGLARHDRLPARETERPEATLAPTRLDVPAGANEDTPIGPGRIWLLRVRQDRSALRHHRGTTADVIRWYEEGALPEYVEAARPEENRYRPLTDYFEFRTLRPATPRRSRPARRRRYGLFASGEWLTVLNLSVVCLTGILSAVLSALLIVRTFSQG